MKTFLAVSLPCILLLMAALWRRQTRTKNATSVDAVWALGTGVQTVFLACFAAGNPGRRAAIVFLAAAWSLRLFSHLYFSRVASGVEDSRYARFRKTWGQGAFFAFYQAQGLLIFVLPLTFLGALENTNPFPAPLDFLSFGLWGLSLAGESLADWQLNVFKSNPVNQGKTCRQGLWRASRHPNYFFEWLLWCSYIPMAVGSPLFYLSILGPALLLFLLLKVSGIPPTEAQALAGRKDYAGYQKATSAFVPWFPKP